MGGQTSPGRTGCCCDQEDRPGEEIEGGADAQVVHCVAEHHGLPGGDEQPHQRAAQQQDQRAQGQGAAIGDPRGPGETLADAPSSRAPAFWPM